MTQPYNHPIKVQVTTKDVKKENSLPYFREGDCGYILSVPIELSAMKNINILCNIAGSIGDFHDLHFPLLKFAHWFMALTRD